MKLRATTRIRNEAMLSRREVLGWSQMRLADEADVMLHDVTDLESLNYSRINIEKAADQVAMALDIPREAVLPPDLVGQVGICQVVSTAEVDMARLVAPTAFPLLTSSITLPHGGEATTEHLKDQMTKLTDREREVLRYTFGLDGRPKLTFEECGRKFNVTRERVRQIMFHGMRRLGLSIEALARREMLLGEAATRKLDTPRCSPR